MALQMQYVSSKPLGFNKENRIVINLRSADVVSKYAVIKTELLKNSHIVGVAAASVMISTDQIVPHRAPMVDNYNGTPERLVIRNLQVTDDFFEVMGIQMASGRDFSKKLLTDTGTAFIVNETMVKNRGWKDPLGKKIQMDQLGGRVVGVVRDFHFRSLHNAMEPLIINQLQISITNTGMIDAGLNVNMEIEASIDRDGSILDYCRLHDITIQPWSPFQYGFFEGVFLDNPKFPELNQKLTAIATAKGVTTTALAIAWLLHHPARMQPILGTTTPQRVKDSCEASNVTLTRQEWYEIYRAAGNKLP